MSRNNMVAWMTVLIVTILVGTRFAGVMRAQGHDHSQHRAPAPRPVAPSNPPSLPPSARQSAAAPKTASTAEATLLAIHSQQLPALQKAVQSAISQIESGNSQGALAELKRIQTSLDALQKTIEPQVKPPFANVRCPIMGAPIQALSVPPTLIRSFGGQRVAFCCAGCPAAWDQLPYPQKAAKLAAAGGPPK